MKPSVDRLLYKWIDRDIDFDTWTKPLNYFGQKEVTPVTIHAAGDTLRAEKELSKKAELKEWRGKMVVSNPRFHTHRLKIFFLIGIFL